MWKQISRTVQTFPSDLTGILVLLVAVNVLFRLDWFTGATVAGARVHTLLGIPVLLFVPGYLLVAVLFPASGSETQNFWESTREQGIDWVERLALSFGMSVAILPIFALVVGTWWGFTLTNVLNGLSILLVLGVVLAALQRIRTPDHLRYSVASIPEDLGFERTGVPGGWNVDTIASVLLVVAVLAAVGSVGYAVATPYQSTPSTTMYLATENETGSLVTAGYPSGVTVGEGTDLVLGLQNSEERRQEYTVVIQLERVETSSSGTRISESAEVDRLHTVVPAGATWNSSQTVGPGMVGEDLRLHYYLYRGETAPATPTSATAYRDVYIWVNVSNA